MSKRAAIGLIALLSGCAIYPNGTAPQQQQPTTIIEPQQQQQQQPSTTYVTPYVQPPTTVYRAYPLWLSQYVVVEPPHYEQPPRYEHHPYVERCDYQCQQQRKEIQHQQWLRDHGYRQ
jgi:hypothetical protein